MLQTIDALLETQPVSSIYSDEVLELSGIFRSPLYHHFEVRADLIDIAMARRFPALIVQKIQNSIKPLFQQARTRDELIAALNKSKMPTMPTSVPNSTGRLIYGCYASLKL